MEFYMLIQNTGTAAVPAKAEPVVRTAPKTYDALYDYSVERWFDTRRMVEEAALEDEGLTPLDIS
jgi:hypothetical protein